MAEGSGSYSEIFEASASLAENSAAQPGASGAVRSEVASEPTSEVEESIQEEDDEELYSESSFEEASATAASATLASATAELAQSRSGPAGASASAVESAVDTLADSAAESADPEEASRQRAEEERRREVEERRRQLAKRPGSSPQTSPGRPQKRVGIAGGQDVDVEEALAKDAERRKRAAEDEAARLKKAAEEEAERERARQRAQEEVDAFWRKQAELDRQKAAQESLRAALKGAGEQGGFEKLEAALQDAEAAGAEGAEVRAARQALADEKAKLQRIQDEEAARKQAEEAEEVRAREEAARRQAEEEAERRAREEAARKQAEEEVERRIREEAAQKAAEEEAERKAREEAAQKAAEEEAERKAREEAEEAARREARALEETRAAERARAAEEAKEAARREERALEEAREAERARAAKEEEQRTRARELADEAARSCAAAQEAAEAETEEAEKEAARRRREQQAAAERAAQEAAEQEAEEAARARREAEAEAARRAEEAAARRQREAEAEGAARQATAREAEAEAEEAQRRQRARGGRAEARQRGAEAEAAVEAAARGRREAEAEAEAEEAAREGAGGGRPAEGARGPSRGGAPAERAADGRCSRPARREEEAPRPTGERRRPPALEERRARPARRRSVGARSASHGSDSDSRTAATSAAEEEEEEEEEEDAGQDEAPRPRRRTSASGRRARAGDTAKPRGSRGEGWARWEGAGRWGAAQWDGRWARWWHERSWWDEPPWSSCAWEWREAGAGRGGWGDREKDFLWRTSVDIARAKESAAYAAAAGAACVASVVGGAPLGAPAAWAAPAQAARPPDPPWYAVGTCFADPAGGDPRAQATRGLARPASPPAAAAGGPAPALSPAARGPPTPRDEGGGRGSTAACAAEAQGRAWAQRWLGPEGAERPEPGPPPHGAVAAGRAGVPVATLSPAGRREPAPPLRESLGAPTPPPEREPSSAAREGGRRLSEADVPLRCAADFGERLVGALATVVDEMLQMKYGCSLDVADFHSKVLALAGPAAALSVEGLAAQVDAERCAWFLERGRGRCFQLRLPCRRLAGFAELRRLLRLLPGTASAVAVVAEGGELDAVAAFRGSRADAEVAVGRRCAGEAGGAPREFGAGGLRRAVAVEPVLLAVRGAPGGAHASAEQPPPACTGEYLGVAALLHDGWPAEALGAAAAGGRPADPAEELLAALHAPAPSAGEVRQLALALESQSLDAEGTAEVFRALGSWLQAEPLAETARGALAEARTCAAVVAGVRRAAGHAAAAVWACRSIGLACRHRADVAAALVQHSAPAAVCRVLEGQPAARDVQKHGLHALGCLAMFGGGGAEVAAAGAFKLALRALSQHRRHASVQLGGLELLRCLALQDSAPLPELGRAAQAAKAALPADGAVHRAADAVLALAVQRAAADVGVLLDTTQASEPSQRSGLCTYGQLAALGGVAWRGAAAGATGRVLRAMRNFKANADLQAVGLWALARLVERAGAPAAGMAEAAECAKARHLRSASVQRQAEVLLARLVQR